MAIRPVPQRFPGAALSGTQTQLLGSLAFPDAGGVQAVDKTGAVFDLVSSTGSLIPSADNVDSLGSGSFRWLNGYISSVIGGSIKSRVSGSDRTVIAYGADIAAVNNLSINAGATGVAPSLVAASLVDAAVSLTIAPQGAANILLNGGATGGVSIGVNAASKVGFFDAAPVVQGAAVPDPAGGGTVDTEARAAIALILTRLRTPGFIAT